MKHLFQYFTTTATNVESPNKQRAIFLSVCGLTKYQPIRNILAMVRPTEHSFTELVTLVEHHRTPKPSAIENGAIYRNHRHLYS